MVARPVRPDARRFNQFGASGVVQGALESPVHAADGHPAGLVEELRGLLMPTTVVLDDEPRSGQ